MLRSWNRWLLWVALAVAGPGLRAETPEQLFERANTAYEQDRFEEALEAYRAVLRYKIEDPILEYNLANTEFKLGHLGSAILHYERARRLDPTDGDIAANLAYAQSFAFDRVEVPQAAPLVQWARKLQDAIGPDRQVWIAVALTWLVFGIVTWCSARPGGWAARWGWTLGVVLVAMSIAWGSWYSAWQRLDGRRIAVVQRDSAEVLAGPGTNNATLFTVHEGLTLVVRAERDEWVQVSLPNGFNGWIARRAIEIV